MDALKCIVIVSFVAACSSSPPTYVDLRSGELSSHGGVTYVNGNAFTGIAYALDSLRDTVAYIPFKNGKEHGEARTYFRRHQLRERRHFVNGWKEGVHEGFFENGSPRFRYEFKKDVFDGEQREWNDQGLLFRLAHYQKGQESGQQQAWYDNGKIKSNYVIREGKRYGLLGTKNCKNVSDSLFRVR